MRAGETWNARKTLTWFTNFPFSFGLYISEETSLLVYADGRVTNKHIDIEEQGIFEITSKVLKAGAKSYSIKDYNGKIQQATFDTTFDFTFYLKTSSKYTELAAIKTDNTEKGVYLRWVDRHGFYRYWLFTQGDESRAISSDTSFMRNNLGEYDDTIFGYLGANGRRQGYGREDTIPLCAPLVDRDVRFPARPCQQPSRGYVPRWRQVAECDNQGRNVHQDNGRVAGFRLQPCY